MDRVMAKKVRTEPGKGVLPDPADWERAHAVSFCWDWRGENPDPQRETEVRLLWSRTFLFVRFHCRFRGIYIYEGGGIRRDQLWQRDVAELFIRREADALRHYREFEISPNGDWLDLDIKNGEKTDLFCALTSRVTVHPAARIWTAELALPLDCMTSAFDPGETWRLNLFRIEGPEPDRFYSAWQPTHTPRPNFHVPERFAALLFAE